MNELERVLRLALDITEAEHKVDSQPDHLALNDDAALIARMLGGLE